VIVHPSPIIDFIPSFVSSCSPYAWHGELGSLSEHTDQVVWFIPGVGGFNGQEVDVIIEEPGLYDVQVTATSSFGCMTQQYVSDVIQVLSNPIAAFRYHPAELTTLEYVAQFTDLSNGALNYLWTFDEFGTSTDPEPSFAFPHEDPATFQVCLRVENEYGCADSTCRSISLDNEYILFAPNAFTPDDDGINDTFLPVLRGFDNDTYHLQIYDRWGEMVFETRDVSEPWTGNVRGGEYYGEDNVYNWIIRIKDREISDFQLFRGSVILLR
jgi:gliding motility-associated-like protein